MASHNGANLIRDNIKQLLQCMSVETYWCLPLRPCPVPLPCSASQKHLGPGHCRENTPFLKCALPTLWINTPKLLYNSNDKNWVHVQYWKLTSMSASMLAHSERSLHPSYPSNTPAFSVEGWEYNPLKVLLEKVTM